VVVWPAEKRIHIDHAFEPGQQTEADVARAMLIFGTKTKPSITLNGTQLADMKTRTVEGRTAYVVPLR